MAAERISFQSAGLKLNGYIHKPAGMKPGEKRPAFMVLHGFGSNCTSSNSVLPAEMLCDWGYVALRFDFRGCGESEGKRANTVCLEQVEDTRNAVSFLETRPEVDGKRVAVVGSSFGAAVAVYSGGVDKRIAAVISSGGWGDGESKFRKQHESPAAWQRFTEMMARGKAAKAKGETIMVPRFDIVPIPEHLRGHLAQNSIMEGLKVRSSGISAWRVAATASSPRSSPEFFQMSSVGQGVTAMSCMVTKLVLMG